MVNRRSSASDVANTMSDWVRRRFVVQFILGLTFARLLIFFGLLVLSVSIVVLVGVSSYFTYTNIVSSWNPLFASVGAFSLAVEGFLITVGAVEFIE